MSSPLISTGTAAHLRDMDHEMALLMEAQRVQMHRINALLDDLGAARSQAEVAVAELAVFRTQVRDLAIEKREEMNFCVPGLNEALGLLGLDPMTRKFRVPVTITATREVYVDVEAADEDHAREEIEEDWELAWGEIPWSERSEWSHSEQEVADTYRIEEVSD